MEFKPGQLVRVLIHHPRTAYLNVGDICIIVSNLLPLVRPLAGPEGRIYMTVLYSTHNRAKQFKGDTWWTLPEDVEEYIPTKLEKIIFNV